MFLPVLEGTPPFVAAGPRILAYSALFVCRPVTFVGGSVGPIELTFTLPVICVVLAEKNGAVWESLAAEAVLVALEPLSFVAPAVGESVCAVTFS